jgi:hypothetical protein
LDILVRDMPIYSSTFFTELIEPAWRVLVLEMTLYINKVVFSKDIEYSDNELVKMKEEGYVYSRGYESDDEEETYGIEGLVQELVDLAIDLLKRNGVMEALQDHMLTLLLCLKNYALMPDQSILLWKKDPNLFISEEYDDENVNSIRNKAVSLIKDVTKEIDDSIILKFLSIILSEFSNGINPENYLDVIKLDDYCYLFPYFEKMNTEESYIQRRHEANLLLLGSLSDDIMMIRDKKKISSEEIDQLMNFLFNIISQGQQNKFGISGILVGRALWCTSKLLSLIKDNKELVIKIFEGICLCILEESNKDDFSVLLIGVQCLTDIREKLPEGYKCEILEKVLIKLIDLIQLTNEDTISIPIDCIISLSILDREKSLIVPLKASKIIIGIYLENFNHPTLGVKLLQLIKTWCEDERSSKFMCHLFVPFAINVFENFFNSLIGEDKQTFEEVKKTVMTEHGGSDFGLKGSLDMLPVSYINSNKITFIESN